MHVRFYNIFARAFNENKYFDRGCKIVFDKYY